LGIGYPARAGKHVPEGNKGRGWEDFVTMAAEWLVTVRAAERGWVLGGIG